MANIDERIQAAQKALEDAEKLYSDGERKYKAAEAVYNQAKTAAAQAAGFVKALSNTNIDTLQALKLAASFAPDPKEYAAAVNQPGADIQAIQRQQLNSAIGKSNVAELARKKAEREIQQATKFLNGISARIATITNQLGIVISGISLRRKADIEKLKSTAKVKTKRKKITLNNARAFIKKNKAAIKAVAKAALLYITAKVLNDQIQALSANVQQLSELVDSVNDQIESVETKQDVLKARITRDAALVSLNNAERQITKIRDTFKTLETILIITSLALNILLLFPIPTTPKVVQKIVNVMLTLDSITIIVGITKSALDDLVAEVQYQKSRLLPISDVIDQAINDNLDPLEIAGLLSGRGNLGQLGLIEGIIYRGFEFAIYEENDPRFVVAGNKRRYAVALDRSGFIALQSRPSFTLDPDVLIEELKLIIDEQNLEA